MNKQYTEAQKQQVMKEVTETGNLTLVSEKHGVPKSTVATWLSRKQPHNIEKHKQKSELKDVKKKLADAELKNKVLTELLKKTYQVWNND
mgnify:FL=1